MENTREITTRTMNRLEYDSLSSYNDNILYDVIEGNGSHSFYKGDSPFVPEIPEQGVINVTYAELKGLRDNAQLVPGQSYRITDYQCITLQSGTSNAGHQFDIIVQAIDKNNLSEDAKATYHNGDTYFSESNLHAWNLKYDIDAKQIKSLNNSIKCRYDSNTNYTLYRNKRFDLTSGTYRYFWSDYTSVHGYTDVENPSINDIVKVKRLTSTTDCSITQVDIANHKGFIYQMTDEFNNTAPYDFKNMKFDGKYTFRYAANNADNGSDGSLKLYKINTSATIILFYNNTLEYKYKAYGDDIPMVIINGLYVNNNILKQCRNVIVNIDGSSSSSFKNNILINCDQVITGGGECNNNYMQGCMIEIGGDCYSNKLYGAPTATTSYNYVTGFGKGCKHNNIKYAYFGTGVSNQTISGVTFKRITNPVSYIEHCEVNFNYLSKISSSVTTSSSAVIKRTIIDKSMTGENITLDTVGQNYEIHYGKNSAGNVVKWCPADLVPSN